MFCCVLAFLLARFLFVCLLVFCIAYLLSLFACFLRFVVSSFL
jgi:hypothetical protein